MKAVKGNKVYHIDEPQKKFYQDAGFDIKDADGNVIAYGRGKTVPYDDHAKLKKENDELRAKLAEQEAMIKMAAETSEPEVKETKKAGSKKAGE